MAASHDRFSFAHASALFGSVHYDDVRAVCTELRRDPEPGWYLRLFDPATGRLLLKLPVLTSGLVTRRQARLTGPQPGYEDWAGVVEKIGGCDC